MNKFVETFLKSAITVFVGMITMGIWYTVKIIVTVDERITKLETVVNSNVERTNAIYTQYEIQKEIEKQTERKIIKTPL